MSLITLFLASTLLLAVQSATTWKEVKPILRVDNNDVKVSARRNNQGYTRIFLVTPPDAWTKEFKIASNNGYWDVKCGDSYGYFVSSSQVHSFNSYFSLPNGYKFNYANVGRNNKHVTIEFIKAKTFGWMTTYGSLILTDAITNKGYDIFFIWPNDNDDWGNFKNILSQTKTTVSDVVGIANNVLSIGEENRKDAIELIKAIGSLKGAAMMTPDNIDNNDNDNDINSAKMVQINKLNDINEQLHTFIDEQRNFNDKYLYNNNNNDNNKNYLLYFEIGFGILIISILFSCIIGICIGSKLGPNRLTSYATGYKTVDVGTN